MKVDINQLSSIGARRPANRRFRCVCAHSGCTPIYGARRRCGWL